LGRCLGSAQYGRYRASVDTGNFVGSQGRTVNFLLAWAVEGSQALAQGGSIRLMVVGEYL